MVPYVSFSDGKSILEPVLIFFVYVLNSLAETFVTDGEASSLSLLFVFSLGQGARRDRAIKRRDAESSSGIECTNQRNGSRDGKADKRKGT